MSRTPKHRPVYRLAVLALALVALSGAPFYGRPEKLRNQLARLRSGGAVVGQCMRGGGPVAA
jgi:hypothetical protein